MIYQAELVLPPQTPQDNPVCVEFTIPKGTVNRIGVLFPAGCAALAHVQIYHNEYQVWPTTPGKSFVGDYMYMTFEESYELPEAWNYIRIVGWNEDDSYEHCLNVWLAVTPVEEKWSLLTAIGVPGWVGGE